MGWGGILMAATIGIGSGGVQGRGEVAGHLFMKLCEVMCICLWSCVCGIDDLEIIFRFLGVRVMELLYSRTRVQISCYSRTLF